MNRLLHIPLRAEAVFLAGKGPRPLVLDTNIVLDLLVFNDAAIHPVRALLAAGRLQWLATDAMRSELERVLAYPHIVPRLQFYGLSPQDVMQAYASQVRWVEAAAHVPAVCKDADDQKFIDLAVAHRAVLLSKDKAVICMRKRLLALDTYIGTAIIFDGAMLDEVQAP